MSSPYGPQSGENAIAIVQIITKLLTLNLSTIQRLAVAINEF